MCTVGVLPGLEKEDEEEAEREAVEEEEEEDEEIPDENSHCQSQQYDLE